MSHDDMKSVAVVNHDGDRTAIWHVAAEPIAQTARLCGAWVTDDLDILRNVVATRKIVLVGDEPSDYIKALLTHAGGVTNIKATLDFVEQHIKHLDERHMASLTPKGSRRAPISWPPLCQVPDWNSLPPVPGGVVQDQLIRSTIAVAQWFARLADTWSAIEAIRTSRSHLSTGSPSPLALPLVLSKDR